MKLFSPTKKFIKNTNLFEFEKYILKKYEIKFKNYFNLWNWSNKYSEKFWLLILEYFKIEFKLKGRQQVLKKNKFFFKNQFFSNYSINYFCLIENNQSSDLAIHFIGENNFEKISYKELNLRVNALSSFIFL